MTKTPDLRPYAGEVEWFKTPFTVVDIKGTVWNVATDRAWIVAAKGKGHYPRWSGNMAQLNVILGLIQSLPVDPRIVEVSVLKQWASSDHTGKIMGASVDLKRLAKLLDLLRGSLQIWDASSVMRQDPCLGMCQEVLRIFLMGQAQEDTPSHVFDTMKFTKPLEKPIKPAPDGWAAFDLAMSLDED
jgi:hypothetical protein